MHYQSRLNAILGFLFLIFLSTAKCFGQENRFIFGKFITNQDDTLLYRLAEPDYNPNRKYPLVIFLHGSGERGNDNISQLKWGVLNFVTDENISLYPAYILAPQCPADQDWSDFRSYKGKNIFHNKLPTPPMQLLLDLIPDLIKSKNIDPDRIYITGLSMGGFGTFDAIAYRPDLFAAAVPVCGGGDPQTVSTFKHIPIWIFHGVEDPAVSFENSWEMASALIKAGNHPGLTLYPETGHFAWLKAYQDQYMLQWLFRQHR